MADGNSGHDDYMEVLERLTRIEGKVDEAVRMCMGHHLTLYGEDHAQGLCKTVNDITTGFKVSRIILGAVIGGAVTLIGMAIAIASAWAKATGGI